MTTSPAARTYIGEFLATFIFFFSVCACTLNAPAINAPTIGAISAGFTAFAVVFCFNGHFNTAVTLGAIVGRKMDVKSGLIYIALQLVASFAAIGAVDLMFPSTTNAQSLMVMPGPNVSTVSALIMEVVLTFILVLVIFRSAMGVVIRPRSGIPAESPVPVENTGKDIAIAAQGEEIQASAQQQQPEASPKKDLKDLEEGKGVKGTADQAEAEAEAEGAETLPETEPLETVKEFNARVKAAETRKNHAPLVIGLTIGFLATLGSSVSGGAFNPLRVTAPAFFTLNFNYVWIYWVGDCIGGILAGLVHYHVFEDNSS